MKLIVSSMKPRDNFGMILVEIQVAIRRQTTIAERSEATYDGGQLSLFVPASDSVATIRREAMKRLRLLAQDILDAPETENDEDEVIDIAPIIPPKF